MPTKKPSAWQKWAKANPEKAQANKNKWAKSENGQAWLKANQQKKNDARKLWRERKKLTAPGQNVESIPPESKS